MAAAAIAPSPPPLPPALRDLSVHEKDINGELSTALREAKQLHCRMLRTGQTQTHELVAACGRAPAPESLRYAVKAFELSGGEEQDRCSSSQWNSLIRGFSSTGSVDEALELFLRMLGRGVAPDRFTFPPLLGVCSKAGAFHEGVQLHGFFVKMGGEAGIGGDLYVNNSLIHFYSEHGEMDSAQRVFDGMGERNVVSWTSLINGYARGDRPRKAVSLFYDMEREDGIEPNSVTMACVVSACTKLQDLDLGKKIHAYIMDFRIGLGTTLVNSLVDMYMKCEAEEVAEQLFSECQDRNVVLWNTMISNYARRGMAKESLALFDEMLLSSVRPDRVTVVAMVSASAQLGEVVVGRRLHGYVLRHGLDIWDSVSNSIIDMYMKCGERNDAYRVFDMMRDKTLVSWNTLIAGCVRNGDMDSAWRHFNMMPGRDRVSWNTMIDALIQESEFQEAITLFRAMQGSDQKPDRVTMVSIASACGYLGALDLAKWLYTYVSKKRIPQDVKLGTALVDMFAKCGDPRSSMLLFDEMSIKDVSAWTAAIGAMAIEGNGQRALELFQEMVYQGVKPDERVFVGVLTACSHGGLVEEGCRFFQSVSKVYGFTPQVIHYGCMVDLLGRAGLLNEARALIESMPMEPNDVIWGALLAASRVHNDLELAEYAAKQVMNLTPERSGIHVLLSNVYASARRWQDVARVRLSLKEKGVQKLPGSSLIEVDGAIHEFTSSDESHPHMAQIAEMLNEIGDKGALGGYVPDLDNVLLDVNEEEKQYLLNRHSEKMAVAFGLISTGHGVPIRVVKNLRICSDCHSFMKFVSAIYDREIAVRDSNRLQ